MPPTVKTRTYRSPARAEQAAETRRRILTAARDLFAAQGFEQTAVRDIATRAGVSVDTVYASVGRKPELAIAVVDMSLGSADDPLPVEERPYVRAIREASTARGKIEAYAAGLSEVMPRTAPLLEALKRAGQTHPPSAAARAHIDERRAANMRHFAAELRDTGELREDVTDDWVADLVWSMNSPEYHLLVASRGVSPAAYADLLVEVWTRTLLRPQRRTARRSGP